MKLRRLSAILLGLPLLGACTQFVGSAEEDTTTFANYTEAMVGQIDFEFQRDRSTLLRGELFDSHPDTERLIELEELVYRVLERIVEYSLDLVVIEGSFGDQEGRVQAYADYLDELRDSRDEIRDLGIVFDGVKREQLIARVRQQSDMLSALREAQPLIYAVVRHTSEVLDEIKRLEGVLDDHITSIIDGEAAGIIAYSEQILRQRNEVAAALTLLDSHFHGEHGALDELQGSPALARLGEGAGDSSPHELEELLVRRLEFLRRSERPFESTYKLDQRAHAELDLLVRLHDNEIRQIRSVLIAWAIMHQRMALGIKLPATWYDLRRSPRDLFHMARVLMVP